MLTFSTPVSGKGGNRYLLGDVDVNGCVNILDINLIAVSFGTNTNDPFGFGQGKFNPDCDLNKDGWINILDITICGLHFSEVSDWSSPLHDYEFIAEDTYWCEGSFGYGGNYSQWFYYCEENGTIKMQLNERNGWNNVGMYQGSKPFGWGTAPHIFPYIPDTKNITVDWRAMIEYSELWTFPSHPDCLDAQTNLGIDFWFETIHPTEGNKTFEIYVLFDCNGLLSVPLHTYRWFINSVDYVSVQYHYCGMEYYVWKTITNYNLNQHIEYVKDNCERILHGSDYFKEATWYLRGIDCVLEGTKAEAIWWIDYCYLYVS